MKRAMFRWNWGSLIQNAVMTIIGFLSCWVFINTIEMRERTFDLERLSIITEEDMGALWRAAKRNSDSITAIQVDVGVMRELITNNIPNEMKVTILSPDIGTASVTPSSSSEEDTKLTPTPDSNLSSLTTKDFDELLNRAEKLRERTPEEFRQDRLMEQRVLEPHFKE